MTWKFDQGTGSQAEYEEQRYVGFGRKGAI